MPCRASSTGPIDHLPTLRTERCASRSSGCLRRVADARGGVVGVGGPRCEEIEGVGSEELYLVPGAGHVDLYDGVELIPWNKLTSFYTDNL